MLIIVESGSTKTEWSVLQNHQLIYSTKTIGINPSTQVELDVLIDVELVDYLYMAKKIVYFGAGVNTIEKEGRIKQWLSKYTQTIDISVRSDIFAAILATCGDNAGIVGILGTGSNSCVFDGKNIVDQLPSLGYIIGDEGGGFHIGKALIKSYFYRQMPKSEFELFESMYHPSLDEVLKKIYLNSDKPNAYIASFAKFFEVCDSEWSQSIIRKCISTFFENKILCYTEYASLPLHLVGSVAFANKAMIKELCIHYKIEMGKIIQSPMQGLVRYYSNT